MVKPNLFGDNARLKIAAGIFWALAILAGFLWANSQSYNTTQALRLIYYFVSATWFGPLLYLLLYALRPFTLFPAMLLTILSGSIFGLWEGLLIAVIGENCSANVAYLIGRFFGGGRRETGKRNLLAKWRPALENQAIPTVIILRAAYLPFDPVNFACGLIALPWYKYFIASLIGLLPPMVTFVSFGATVNTEKLLVNMQNLNPQSLINGTQLLISLGLLVVSVFIAVVIHLRQRGEPGLKK